MHPEIQKAVDAGKLSAAAGQTLEQLQPGTYVVHKSWGFGQVDSVNFLVSQMTIHFKTKKGHTMQLQYAAESLQPITADHILAQKAADLAAVKARAKDDPVGLMRTMLEQLRRQGHAGPDHAGARCRMFSARRNSRNGGKRPRRR